MISMFVSELACLFNAYYPVFSLVGVTFGSFDFT